MHSAYENIGYIQEFMERTKVDKKYLDRLNEILNYLQAIESKMISLGHITELVEVRKEYKD